MNTKMTVHEFAEQWSRDHPLPDNCTAIRWMDDLVALREAYREYDPDGLARFDREEEARLRAME
jgi:hypothetical protein